MSRRQIARYSLLVTHYSLGKSTYELGLVLQT